MATYEYLDACRICGDTGWNGVYIDGVPFMLDCNDCVKRAKEYNEYLRRQDERDRARRLFYERMNGADFTNA